MSTPARAVVEGEGEEEVMKLAVKKRPAKKPARRKTAAPKVRYYKVLTADGRSAHGGSLQWSLPKNRKPGDWHEVDGALSMCRVGLHLTREPARWMAVGYRVFECECDGEMLTEDGVDKVCVRRARLLKECDGAALAAVNIFTSGRHEVREGYVWASGNAVVVLKGSSSAELRESSSAELRESSRAVLWGSSRAVLWGSSRAELRESSSAVLWGSSRADSHDSGTVLTFAPGATAVLHGPLAAWIKRGGGKAECVFGA